MPVNACCCGAATHPCVCWGGWTATYKCGDGWTLTPMAGSPAGQVFGRCGPYDGLVHDWIPGPGACAYTKITETFSAGCDPRLGGSCGAVCTPPDPGLPFGGEAPPDCCPCSGRCWARWRSTYDCATSTWGDPVHDTEPPFFPAVAGACISDDVAAAYGLSAHDWEADPDVACDSIKVTVSDSGCTCDGVCTPEDPGTPSGTPTGCCPPCTCPCGSWPGVSVADGGSGVYPCGTTPVSLTAIYTVTFNYAKFDYAGTTTCIGGTVTGSCVNGSVTAVVHATGASCSWSVVPHGSVAQGGETCVGGETLTPLIGVVSITLNTTPGSCGWYVNISQDGGIATFHLPKIPAGAGPGGSLDPRGTYAGGDFCHPGISGNSTQWTITSVVVS